MSDCILPKVAAGDRAAVDECLDRYGGLVWSLARRQFANYADAEDAVQEIFVDIWRSAGRFDERVASEPTFVAMIARRRLIDRRRRHERTVETTTISPEIEPPAAAAAGTATVEFREEAALARKQLELLRPDERKVIELAIDRGLSNAQIAETLQMPL